MQHKEQARALDWDWCQKCDTVFFSEEHLKIHITWFHSDKSSKQVLKSRNHNETQNTGSANTSHPSKVPESREYASNQTIEHNTSILNSQNQTTMTKQIYDSPNPNQEVKALKVAANDETKVIVTTATSAKIMSKMETISNFNLATNPNCHQQDTSSVSECVIGKNSVTQIETPHLNWADSSNLNNEDNKLTNGNRQDLATGKKLLGQDKEATMEEELQKTFM